MKIEVESKQIIAAVRKLEGIDILLENAEDAIEAIGIILKRPGLFTRDLQENLEDIKITSSQKYTTSAVEYKIVFLLEFQFRGGVSLEKRVAIINEFQKFLNKI